MGPIRNGRVLSREDIGAECAVEGKLTLSDSNIAFHHVLEISTWYRDPQLFM